MVPGWKHRVPGALAAIDVATIELLDGERAVLAGKMDHLDEVARVLGAGRLRVPIVGRGFAGVIDERHDRAPTDHAFRMLAFAKNRDLLVPLEPTAALGIKTHPHGGHAI